MSGSAHPIEAYVLAKAAHTGDHLVLTCFSATEGLLTVLLRAPGYPKPNTPPTPDLFDFLSLTIQRGRNSPAEGPWFVREHRLLARHATIGRDFATLAAASRLARLVSRNVVPADTRASVEALLGRAFAALARPGTRPALIYLKSLYCLARDEGLPVRQAWLPTLPAQDRNRMTTALGQASDAPAVPDTDVLRLTRLLELYLANEHDLVFDPQARST